jgi:hypothetical protein
MTITTWGRWTLNDKNACLEITIAPSTGAIYQVPLEELNTAAATLDWIYQIQEKTWATSQDQGDLINAIVEIFGRGVAGGGTETKIDTKQILANRYGIVF